MAPHRINHPSWPSQYSLVLNTPALLICWSSVEPKFRNKKEELAHSTRTRAAQNVYRVLNLVVNLSILFLPAWTIISHTCGIRWIIVIEKGSECFFYSARGLEWHCRHSWHTRCLTDVLKSPPQGQVLCHCQHGLLVYKYDYESLKNSIEKHMNTSCPPRMEIYLKTLAEQQEGQRLSQHEVWRDAEYLWSRGLCDL